MLKEKTSNKLSMGSIKAVAYARVSSKEQEKEGYSIDAQLKLLRDHAARRGFHIVQEFIDVETAKTTGRAKFEAMIDFFKKEEAKREGQRCRIILVEKTDRLYRNFMDSVKLDIESRDLELHLVKEGEVLSRESKSAAKFMHSIRLAVAKQYSDNLSEEAKKGMAEKAAQGFWPTKAPFGYVNVVCGDKRIIQKDPQYASLVAKLFEWYAMGLYSVKELTKKAHAEGLVYRRTGIRVSASHVHKMLSNPIYYGDFYWDGVLCKGKHEPTISKELFDQVQLVLNGRNKPRQKQHDWPFRGLVSCGHCGCAYTAEQKKGKYTYYRCTGHRGKCPEKFVREEELARQFGEALNGIRLDREVLEWVTTALRESHKDKTAYHAQMIATLRSQYDALQGRLERMYEDKLDGKVSEDYFERKNREWRIQQSEIQRSLEAHQAADESFIEEGVRILELTQRAVMLYEKQTAHEKRELLNFVFSNSSWKDGKLNPTFRIPFSYLANTNAAYKQLQAASGAKKPDFRFWLGN